MSELFSWLVEVIEGAEDLYEGAKMVWATRFEPHAPESHRSEFHRMHSGGNGGSGGGGGSSSSPETRKPTTKLEVQKDDIQAVVPISKVQYLWIYMFHLLCYNAVRLSEQKKKPIRKNVLQTENLQRI